METHSPHHPGAASLHSPCCSVSQGFPVCSVPSPRMDGHARVRVPLASFGELPSSGLTELSWLWGLLLSGPLPGMPRPLPSPAHASAQPRCHFLWEVFQSPSRVAAPPGSDSLTWIWWPHSSSYQADFCSRVGGCPLPLALGPSPGLLILWPGPEQLAGREGL